MCKAIALCDLYALKINPILTKRSKSRKVKLCMTYIKIKINYRVVIQMVSKIHDVIMVKRPASVRSTTLSLRLAHDSLLSRLLL